MKVTMYWASSTVNEKRGGTKKKSKPRTLRKNQDRRTPAAGGGRDHHAQQRDHDEITEVKVGEHQKTERGSQDKKQEARSIVGQLDPLGSNRVGRHFWFPRFSLRT